MYIILKRNNEDFCIKRISDSSSIPFCEENRDYQAYLEWVNEGNIAEVEEI